ncbi:hypothetical protein UlMin_026702 [Ulmus minor]
MAEDIILDFSYFNVIGSDPKGRLGEAPRPELREHGRILGACFDAARGFVPRLKKAKASKVGIYNVGTGKALVVFLGVDLSAIAISRNTRVLRV